MKKLHRNTKPAINTTTGEEQLECSVCHYLDDKSMITRIDGRIICNDCLQDEQRAAEKALAQHTKPSPETLETVRQDGENARDQGYKITDNPYKSELDFEKWTAWNKGFEGVQETPVQTNAPVTLPWPQDIIEEIKKASKQLKRTDIDLCILLAPDRPTRYAVRLGGPEAHWIKDINPLEFLQLLSSPPKELAARSKEAHDNITFYQSTVEMAENITSWLSSKQIDQLPGESRGF